MEPRAADTDVGNDEIPVRLYCAKMISGQRNETARSGVQVDTVTAGVSRALVAGPTANLPLHEGGLIPRLSHPAWRTEHVG